MKEERFFFHPNPETGLLPADEATHATRVLRLGVGDEMRLIDGRGHFLTARITEATNHRCAFAITATELRQPEWAGHIHIALAPTKNIDRIEWFAEKATEIGIDRISLLDCKNSERRTVKTERIEKIIIAAMKQSHKAYLPQLDEMQAITDFLRRDDLPQQRYIAHCHDPRDIDTNTEATLPFLGDILLRQTDALVLIGPEGDFSRDEVRLAMQLGFHPVSLGTSRLRTETAALVATHLIRLANR